MKPATTLTFAVNSRENRMPLSTEEEHMLKAAKAKVSVTLPEHGKNQFS